MALFTTAQSGDHGGEFNMRLPQVRNAFLASFSLAVSPVFLNQTHSATVHTLDNPPYPSEGDGMLTQRENIALGIFVADCVPLFLFSPEDRVIGLVHVGWKGLGAGIVEETLDQIDRQKWAISSFLFALGPSIGSCCYEVGEEVLAALQPKFSDVPRTRTYLDLRGYIQKLLLKNSVPSNQIFVSPHCTRCRSDLFFSYRRDHTDARMMAFLSLTAK